MTLTLIQKNKFCMILADCMELDRWSDVRASHGRILLMPHGRFYNSKPYVPYITIPYDVLDVKKSVFNIRDNQSVQFNWADEKWDVSLSFYKDGSGLYSYVAHPIDEYSVNNKVSITLSKKGDGGFIHVHDEKTLDNPTSWLFDEATGFFNALMEIHRKTFLGGL